MELGLPRKARANTQPLGRMARERAAAAGLRIGLE